MGQFIGCIDASNTLISNKNICRIHHGSIRSRDFPDCLHNIERHIKQLPVIQNPAGKMLPSGNSDPASAFQSGLLKTVRETAFAGHRLIGQGKKRNMNSLGFDPGTGYFIQVFIAHQHGMMPVSVQNQQRLLKSWKESRKIGKILPMFQIPVNHQRIQFFFFHACHHCCAALLHDLIADQNRDSGTIRLRRCHSSIANLSSFSHFSSSLPSSMIRFSRTSAPFFTSSYSLHSSGQCETPPFRLGT